MIALFILLLLSIFSIHSIYGEHTSSRSTASCTNTSKRFEIRKNQNGNPVLRSCEWAAATDTQTRCQLPNVFANCSALCDPSCPCEDTTENKFGLKYLKADLLCKHGRKANGKPKKRFCNIRKFARMCPKTCKTVIKGCKNSNNKKQCKDKPSTIRTTVPSFQVKCTSVVEEWYRNSDYCDNAKFMSSNCPRKCKKCPADFITTLESPSMEPPSI